MFLFHVNLTTSAIIHGHPHVPLPPTHAERKKVKKCNMKKYTITELSRNYCLEITDESDHSPTLVCECTPEVGVVVVVVQLVAP